MERHLRHFSHNEHSLVLSFYGAEVLCTLCNRSIPSIKGRYTCHECNGCHLHVECATSQEHIDHPFHPLHRLLLAKRSLNDNSCCFYCEKPLSNAEYFYACEQLCSDFYMHISCAMKPPLTITRSNGVSGRRGFEYVCHGRSMVLGKHDAAGANKCLACRSDGSGPAYVCTSQKCKNFLHESCVKYLIKNHRRPFHPHSLRLKVSKRCSSCCRKDFTLVLGCDERGCDFNLCIECTSLNPDVRCRSHDHLLALVEKSCCEIQCDACQKTYKKGVQGVPDEVNQTQSLLFRCMPCAFNFHFLCGPLPSTINYEYHVHNLILSDHSRFKNDSEEYYCDACEKEMDLDFRVYYCEECKYAAHIYCLIPEVTKTIKGDTKNVELKVLGEERWHRLGTDSITEWTLDEIKNMLTVSEKMKLLVPFDNLSYRKGTYVMRGDRFISCQNLEGSIEDADKLGGFLSSGPNDLFDKFGYELDLFTPREGILKLADKYLGQKVQDVGGYLVPVTFAPILNTLLRNGYLKGDQHLQPAMRSIGATLLCIVIDKMCKTKVKDITWEELKEYNFNMQAIKNITNLEINRFLDDRFPLKAFLGLEAIRHETKIREEHDKRIAELEEELKGLKDRLERWKDSREKLKNYASHKSEFMKECSSEAAKWKHRYWGDIWF